MNIKPFIYIICSKFLIYFNDNFLLIFSIIFFFLFFYYIANGFKLSNNKKIKIFQKFLFFYLFISFLLCLFSFFSLPIIYCEDNDIIETNKNNNYNKEISENSNSKIIINGSVVLNKDSAKEISKGIVSGASNVGLGASIGGVAAAVASSIAKAPIPPLQKTALVVIGGIAGSAIHTATTSIKKNLTENSLENINPPSPTDFNINSINEEIIISPIEQLLGSILTLNTISLILIFFLIINFLFIFVFNKDLELN